MSELIKLSGWHIVYFVEFFILKLCIVIIVVIRLLCGGLLNRSLSTPWLAIIFKNLILSVFIWLRSFPSHRAVSIHIRIRGSLILYQWLSSLIIILRPLPSLLLLLPFLYLIEGILFSRALFSLHLLSTRKPFNFLWLLWLIVIIFVLRWKEVVRLYFLPCSSFPQFNSSSIFCIPLSWHFKFI